MLVHWERHTAAVVGQQIKRKECEECGCTYEYQMTRRGEGIALSFFWIGQAAARFRAARRASRNLTRMLEEEVEPIPCPKCGWVSKEMERELARRQYRWMTKSGLLIAFVPSVIALLTSPIWTDGFDHHHWAESWQLIILLCASGLVVGAGMVLLRPLLQWRYNANAPQEATAPSTVSDEWITVQLLDMQLPALCACCLQPSHQRRQFIYEINVTVPLIVCDKCYFRYRVRWYIVAAIFIVLGVLAGVSASWFLDASLHQLFELAIAGFALGCGAAFLSLDRMLGPVWIQGFEKERNTIRLRFKNHDYSKEFVAVSRQPACRD